MATIDQRGNIAAHCDECGTVTTFSRYTGTNELGSTGRPGRPGIEDQEFAVLLRCSGCDRGALGVYEAVSLHQLSQGKLLAFYPPAVAKVPIPEAVPAGIQAEMREAELCAASGALRAASALLGRHSRRPSPPTVTARGRSTSGSSRPPRMASLPRHGVGRRTTTCVPSGTMSCTSRGGASTWRRSTRR
jgi:hypothetical protein